MVSELLSTSSDYDDLTYPFSDPAAPWLPSSFLPGAAAWVKDMGFPCPCSQAGEGGGGLDDTNGADAYGFLLHAS